MSPKLPYGRHSIDETDIAAVVDVLRSDWLTTGPVVKRFEREFARRVGAEAAVACANGTAALHLASLAVGCAPANWVIVPAITFLATANAPRLAGAEIAFADVDPETGLMMPANCEAVLEGQLKTSNVRAVFPVDLNGQCGDPVGLRKVCDQYGLRIVEDACHALGTRHQTGTDKSQVGDGANADLTTFSFHPVKMITSGEGGMVSGRNGELLSRVRRLRNHGMVREASAFESTDQAFDSNHQAHPWYYEMPEVGLNYRLSDILCALGLSQLSRLASFVQRRAALVRQYRKALADLSPTVRPLPTVPTCQPAWHLFVLLIDFNAIGMNRSAIMRALSAKGIGSQVHYVPLYRQPYYRRRYGDIRLPGAEAYYDHCLSLPLFPDMTEKDVNQVVAAFREIIAGPNVP